MAFLTPYRHYMYMYERTLSCFYIQSNRQRTNFREFNFSARPLPGWKWRSCSRSDPPMVKSREFYFCDDAICVAQMWLSKASSMVTEKSSYYHSWRKRRNKHGSKGCRYVWFNITAIIFLLYIACMLFLCRCLIMISKLNWRKSTFERANVHKKCKNNTKLKYVVQ